jgi:hypothetical protein
MLSENTNKTVQLVSSDISRVSWLKTRFFGFMSAKFEYHYQQLMGGAILM